MELLPNNLTLLEIGINCNGSNHELIEFGTKIGKSRDCVHKIFDKNEQLIRLQFPEMPKAVAMN